MKNKIVIISYILIISFVFISCNTNEPVQGVESSISETGDVLKVKVTANKADIKSGLDGESAVIQATKKDSKLDVVNEVNDWYAVQLPEEQVGFIEKDKVTPVVPDDNETEAQGTEDNPVNQTGPANTPGTESPNTNNTEGENATTLTENEQEMLNLVNEARTQNNVPELQVDMELTSVARIKSQDMIDNSYFSHNSPTYGSPFDMMKNFDINYVKGGENIAGNQDVDSAHEALMNSPGHRKNILSTDYTHIGIGIQNGGQYGNMFTQMFISKPQ